MTKQLLCRDCGELFNDCYHNDGTEVEEYKPPICNICGSKDILNSIEDPDFFNWTTCWTENGKEMRYDHIETRFVNCERK